MFFEACDIYNTVSSFEVIKISLEWKSKALVQLLANLTNYKM